MAAAVRTNVLIAATEEAAARARVTAADAVTVDLTDAVVMPPRAGSRGVAPRVDLGRPMHMRIVIDRRLGLEASLDDDINAAVAAVLLGGVDRPQDVRDADVALRRREMRLGIEPGTVRLIPEVGSALALRALSKMFEAVDRHSAVVLNTDALAADLGLPGPLASHLAIIEHAMAEVALSARAARLPWMALAPSLDAGARAALAVRAHAHGAAGVYIASEPEAQGFNSLFTNAGR